MNLIDLHVNNILVKVPKNISLLEALEYSGIYIPRFCYNSMLSISGNCRMCLVEIEKSGKPISSCTFPLLNNLKVFTNTPKIKKAQESVLEFLLLHHPLDCFICDQGGECDLQNQALEFGTTSFRSFNYLRRKVEDKFFGEKISTVMTRCIHCTRCVRFGEEILQNKFLGTMRRGYLTEISSYISNPKIAKEEYLGNVIDLCPVGALTAKNYAFKARPWQNKLELSYDFFSPLGQAIFLFIKENQIVKITPRKSQYTDFSLISDNLRYNFFKSLKIKTILMQKMIYNTRFLSTLTIIQNYSSLFLKKEHSLSNTFKAFIKQIQNTNIYFFMNILSLEEMLLISKQLTLAKFQSNSFSSNYVKIENTTINTNTIYNFEITKNLIHYFPLFSLLHQKKKINIYNFTFFDSKWQNNNNIFFEKISFNPLNFNFKSIFLTKNTIILKSNQEKLYYFFKKLNYLNNIHYAFKNLNEVIITQTFLNTFGKQSKTVLNIYKNSNFMFNYGYYTKNIFQDFYQQKWHKNGLWILPNMIFNNTSGLFINNFNQIINNLSEQSQNLIPFFPTVNINSVGKIKNLNIKYNSLFI